MAEIAHLAPARRVAAMTAVLLLLAAAVATAHDMFVKPARFFVAENAEVLVRILNGTEAKDFNLPRLPTRARPASPASSGES
jgi:hypothetical protein